MIYIRIKNLLLAASLLLLLQSSYATNYYVSPGGSSSNTGLSAADAWDFTYAVSSSSPVGPGDVVNVTSGTYNISQVLIEKSGTPGSPITIKGIGSVDLVGDYSNHTWARGTLHATRQSDLVIENITVSQAGFGGIILEGCSRITVQNCITLYTWATGIGAFPDPDHYPVHGETTDPDFVVTSYDIKVLNCHIEQAQRGVITDGLTTGVPLQEAIDMWGVDGFEVAYNTLVDCHKEGIDLKDGTRNGSVHHNTVTNQNPDGDYLWNGIGIYLDGAHGHSYNIDIYNNIVGNKDNATYSYTRPSGIAVRDEQIRNPLNSVVDVRIFNNIVYNNDGHGVWISDGVSDIDLYNNTIVDNGGFSYDRGIYIEGNTVPPYNIRIMNNIIRANSFRGVDVTGGTNVEVAYNLISGPSPTNGTANYHSNTIVPLSTPIFVAESGSATGNDFRLAPGSPAIDAANSTLVASLDFDDTSRPLGSAPDIGAYEYGSASAGPDLIVTNVEAVPASFNSGDSIQFAVTVKNQGTASTNSAWWGAKVEVNGYFATWGGVTNVLGPGQSITITSSNYWTANSTSFNATGTADYSGAIVESNESNNSSTFNVSSGGSLTTVTLTPDDDSYVRNGSSSNSNYGSSSDLVVRNAVDWGRESFVKFELGSITSVNQAILRLYVNRVTGASSQTIQLVNPDTWSESTITYNNRPTTLGGSVTIPAPTVNGWISVDVTGLASSQASGDGILTLKITGATSQWVEYDSAEGTNPPELEITY